MFYIVAPISTETMARNPGGNGFQLARTDNIKVIYTDKDVAAANAETAAKAKPGIQYGVFVLADVAEAQAKLIKKKVDENGQIVVVA